MIFFGHPSPSGGSCKPIMVYVIWNFYKNLNSFSPNACLLKINHISEQTECNHLLCVIIYLQISFGAGMYVGIYLAQNYEVIIMNIQSLYNEFQSTWQNIYWILSTRLCPVVSLKLAVLHLNLAVDYIHILGSQSWWTSSALGKDKEVCRSTQKG